MTDNVEKEAIERDSASGEAQDTPIKIPDAKWKPGCLTYAIASFLLVAVGGWLGNWFWARSERLAFEAEIKAIQDRGEPVWFVDLEPEPLPEEEDGLQLFLAAAKSLEQTRQQTGAVWTSFEQQHLDGTGPGGNGVMSAYSAADLANFRQITTASTPALDLLRQSLDRGTIRWPIDFKTEIPYALLLEGLEPQRHFANVLKAEGLVAIADGDTDRAITSIQDMFRLIDSGKEEPFLISHLLRVAFATFAMHEIKALLETHDLTAEQRSELDDMLAHAEANFRLKDCYMAERASSITMIASIADSAEPEMIGSLAQAEGPSWWIYANLSALRYRDMSKAVSIFNSVIEHIDETGPQATADLEAIENEISTLSDTYLMTKLTLPSMTSMRRSGLRYRQQLRGLRVALRVDQFYRTKGNFPNSLTDVLDESMPEIPQGTYSNQPVVYRTTPTGFVIYGLGTNGIDDGGGGDQDESDGLVELEYPTKTSADGAVDDSAADSSGDGLPN